MRVRDVPPQQRPCHHPSAIQFTPDNIQKTLEFFRRRFSEYKIEDVIFSLTKKLQQDREMNRNRDKRDIFEEIFDESQRDQIYSEDERAHPLQPQMCRERYTRPIMYPRQMRERVASIAASNDYNFQQTEQIRMVALLYRETGDCQRLAKQFFPDMTQSTYSKIINQINRQVIKNVTSFLRFQCNIQMEHISTEQKNHLVATLKKARNWLGQKSFAQLATYFKFIKKIYERDQQVEISYDEALSLYTTFLLIVKSPHINILEIVNSEQNQKTPPAYIRTDHRSVPLSCYTKEQEKQIVQLYLKLNNFQKTAKKLKELRGESEKWGNVSIRQLLRYVIKKALDKIIKVRNMRFPMIVIKFNQNEEIVKKIFCQEKNVDLKEKLFRFFVTNTITQTELAILVNRINYACTEMADQSVSLPEVLEDEQVLIVPKSEAEDPRIKQLAARNNQSMQSARSAKSVRSNGRSTKSKQSNQQQAPKIEAPGMIAQRECEQEVRTQETHQPKEEEEVSYQDVQEYVEVD